MEPYTQYVLKGRFEQTPVSWEYDFFFVLRAPRTGDYYDPITKEGVIRTCDTDIFYERDTGSVVSGRSLPANGEGYLRVTYLTHIGMNIVGVSTVDQTTQKIRRFVVEETDIEGRIIEKQKPSITFLQLKGRRGLLRVIGTGRESL